KKRRPVGDNDTDANRYEYGRRGHPGMDLELPPHPEVEFQDYEWDSNYQTGPETYLLALRDTGLTSRVRDYRRSLLGDSASLVTRGFLGDINLDISIRERRRYPDMIREDLGVRTSTSFVE